MERRHVSETITHVAETVTPSRVTSRSSAFDELTMEPSVALAEMAPRQQKKRRPSRSRGWLRPRDREQLRLERLQLDVNDLRQEIDSLRVLRSLLYTRVLHTRDAADGSYVRRLREYYDMVHSGYRDTLWPRNGGGPVSGYDYLASIMDARMGMGQLSGLDQFISMWKRYTQCFRGLQFEMVDASPLEPERTDQDQATCEPPSHVVVVATSRFECGVSRQCIPVVFPHLMARPEMQQRLLNAWLRGSGHFTITFDAHSHRIVRFDMSLDIVRALLDALGNPMLVADILDGALFTPDGCIGDLSEYESSRPTFHLQSDRVSRQVYSPCH